MPPKKKQRVSGDDGSKKSSRGQQAGSSEPNSVSVTGVWSDVGATSSKQKYPPLIIFYDKSQEGREKVAGFDIDCTIIKTASGRTFATGASDWQWLYPCVPDKLRELHTSSSYRLCLFTNQAGIEKGKVTVETVKTKIMDIISHLNVPVFAFISTGQDHYRKPNTSMWQYMEENCNHGVKVSHSKSVYVGDAAGREKNWAPGKRRDFSCTDRMFAANLRPPVNFHTPEAFFLGESEAAFSWRSVDPKQVISKHTADKQQTQALQSVAGSDQEMIILVGCPASGKSSFCRSYLTPHGYVHVNRDTLLTQAKCVQAAEESIASGRSVVIDNTNPSKASRAPYIEIAKKHGVSCRCIALDTPLDISHHLNQVRQTLTSGGSRRVPDVAYHVYRKAYEAPTSGTGGGGEGFTQVLTLPFTARFEDDRHEQVFKQWTD